MFASSFAKMFAFLIENSGKIVDSSNEMVEYRVRKYYQFRDVF